MTNSSSSLPQSSALSNLLSNASAKLPTDALPLEILHNLQHQHHWIDLHLWSPNTNSQLPTDSLSALVLDSHPPTRPAPTSHPSPRNPKPLLITGTPPHHSYIHPDFQAHALAHDLSLEQDVPVQKEWVLPLNLAEKWSLSRFADVFDTLPKRQPHIGADGYKHQDAKRLLLGMVSHNGGGGDGTVVYYIMQEGDVKPRQN